MQLFDDGTTQHLLRRQTGGADAGIVWLQRLRIVVQDSSIPGPAWIAGKEGVVFHVFYASRKSA